MGSSRRASLRFILLLLAVGLFGLGDTCTDWGGCTTEGPTSVDADTCEKNGAKALGSGISHDDCPGAAKQANCKEWSWILQECYGCSCTK